MTALNYKNMVKQYYRFEADSEMWDAFYHMRIMGFIDVKTWHKFFDTCRSWYFDKDDNIVKDSNTGEVIDV